MGDVISRQAAIERFDYIRPRDPMTSDYTHGIDVGIALCKVTIREQPPAQLGTNLAEVGTGVPDINVGELISRQQAIDALAKDMPSTYTPDGSHPADEVILMAQEIYADCIQTLKELPSAQPEPSWDCEKCMMEHTDEMEKLEAELAIAKSKQPEPCEDAVPREAVKEIAYGQIRGEYSGIALKEQRETMFRLADSIIRVLPPVTPKQRTGKWIHVSEEMWKCDQCGEISCCSPKYCPDCGSMNEVTE